MGELAFFLFLLLLLFVFILPITAIVKASKAARRQEELDGLLNEFSRRVRVLEEEIRGLKNPPPASPWKEEEKPELKPEPSLFLASQLRRHQAEEPAAVAPPVPTAQPAPLASSTPPPIVPPLSPPTTTAPPVVTANKKLPSLRAAPTSAFPAFNWEQFLGVKMFAWIGGLALFLGVGFAVKFSFDQGWVSPPVRIAMGLLIGIGLILGALWMSREKYAVTVQALCASGTLILYADIFAARSFYQLVSPGVAFLFMILVTATAFTLAIRLNAQTVAVLGLVGGFLTPPLLSTGVDNPVGLFTYVAILDAGLVAVAWRARWSHLVLLGAVATVVMQAGWANKFFEVEKVGVAMTVFLGFAWFFTGTWWAVRRRESSDVLSTVAAIIVPVAAWLLAFCLLAHPYPEIAARPGLLFAFVFGTDLCLLTLAWRDENLRPLHLASGLGVFLLLAIWTLCFLTTDLLIWGLGWYLVFAILHSVFPLLLSKVQPRETPVWGTPLFAPLALLLAMMPIFSLNTLSFAIWPAILLVNVLAVLLALWTGCLNGIVVVLLMTIAAIGAWILKGPPMIEELSGTLLLILAFSLFFFLVGLRIPRWMGGANAVPEGRAPDAPTGTRWPDISPTDLQTLAPSLSSGLPFILLMMVVVRLPLADPSPVFGVATFMLVLMLGLVRCRRMDFLCLAALGGIIGVEYVWYAHRFVANYAVVPLAWHLCFYLGLVLVPFLFQKEMSERSLPWAMAALAGPAHFYLVYKIVGRAYPNSYMGLIPAAFAIPTLLALTRLIKALPADSPRRTATLAWFGGVALFFITLIFPIQFERQWITLGWALEGAALLWLLRRVPHEGLKYTGVALLVVAFVRLSLNPAIFHYHARSGTIILNWYLYAYGIAIACLFAGARFLAPPRHLLRETNIPPILRGLGVILAFLLLNIEIADCYSTGTSIAFEFSGNFARDMTYSLGWGVFAFILLVVGIQRRILSARYAGIALLSVTLLKLFLHDLWSLGGLYRVGSLIGLALVLFPVSFLYQRFMAAKTPPPETDDHAPDDHANPPPDHTSPS